MNDMLLEEAKQHRDTIEGRALVEEMSRLREKRRPR